MSARASAKKPGHFETVPGHARPLELFDRGRACSASEVLGHRRGAAAIQFNMGNLIYHLPWTGV